MSTNWYFYHATEAFNSSWKFEMAEKRLDVSRTEQPMFMTVLDVTGEPDSGDWTKIKYRGPLYFDFDLDSDADDALRVVCDNFRIFLTKLQDQYAFDLSQAWLYASGGKGFHVEIPQECFIPKPPATGTPGLPAIYREIAKKLIVDALDMTVYSARKGRMWRQPNVQRKNGNYKVQLLTDEALEITPEFYREIVKKPRRLQSPGVPTVNAKLALDFESCSRKVSDMMKSKKRKAESTSKVLQVWKSAGKDPDVMAMMMDGAGFREGAQFQQIALQLSIYATTMGWEKEYFLNRCHKLCEEHVSDGVRYNTPEKRRRELARMYDYMVEDDQYAFDPAPIAALMIPGLDFAAIGLKPEAPPEEVAAREKLIQDNPDAAILAAEQDSVRRGVKVTERGVFVDKGDGASYTICRATITDVRSFSLADRPEGVNPESDAGFLGIEFAMREGERNLGHISVTADNFSTAGKLRALLLQRQLAYQGSDSETLGLMDTLVSRSRDNVPIYVVPREGLFILPHPKMGKKIMVYLTKSGAMTNLEESDVQIELQYRPSQANSTYNIDIHRAPDLSEAHLEQLRKLFKINKPTVVADMVGWFLAAHWRSLFMECGDQFPLLQVFGEAGSGKSQTAILLSRLHWWQRETSTKSAMSMTNFALDNLVSTSTSAPLIIDEYKPRELARVGRGKHEKLKDVFKQSYFGGEVGDRGTLNKGGETQLAIISNKATAPICFLGEAVESETAITERSVTVALSQNFQTPERQRAFNDLRNDPEALSAFGRFFVESAFVIDLTKMKEELEKTRREIEDRVPENARGRKAVPARMIHNRAVILLTLRMAKRLCQEKFGDALDADWDYLINAQDEDLRAGNANVSSVSEIAKAVSEIAKLSRKTNTQYELIRGTDYMRADGFTEFRVEEAYDKYKMFARASGDVVLFDTIESFKSALRNFSAVVDQNVVDTPLRQDGSTETIVRMDDRLMALEQVMAFRL